MRWPEAPEFARFRELVRVYESIAEYQIGVCQELGACIGRRQSDTHFTCRGKMPWEQKVGWVSRIRISDTCMAPNASYAMNVEKHHE